MSDHATQSDADYCADLVRKADFDRYATTLFAPVEHRDGLLALYAFNVEIAGVRDHVTQPLAGEIRLQWWDDLLSGKPGNEAAGHPVAMQLFKAVKTHRLSANGLSELIAAHRFDLYDEPMQTVSEMEGYIDQTAARLFWLSARILGERSPLLDALAHHAGLAYGITALLAALPAHAARRQLYLSAELLNRFGAKSEDVLAGRASQELRDAVRSLGLQAGRHLTEAMALLPDLAPPARSSFLLLALVRLRLRYLEKYGFDPFKPKPSSRLQRLWTMWRASRTL